MTRHPSPVLLAACLTCFGLCLGISYPSQLEPASASSKVNLPESFVIAQSPSPEATEQKPLKVGSEGEAVKDLQKKLKELGFYKEAVNGFYDAKTKIAVAEFQKSLGIDVDGIAGKGTLSRLKEEVDKKSKSSDSKDKPAAKDEKKKVDISKIRKILSLVLLTAVILGTIGGGLFLLVKKLDGKKQGAKPNIKSKKKKRDKSKSTPKSLEPKLESRNSLPNHNDIAPQTEPVDTDNHPNGYTSSSLVVVNPNPLENQSPLQTTDSTSLVKKDSNLAKTNTVPVLIKDLKSSDPQKRKKAIWELAQKGDSRAVQPLVDLIPDADSKQRSLILETISQIGIKTLTPMNKALALSLQDDNPDVRKNAIRDLTLVYELVSQVSQLLSYSVNDPDPEVQQTARWALTELERIRNPKMLNELPQSRSSLNFPENHQLGSWKDEL